MDNWHTKTRKDWTHGSGDILVDIQTHTRHTHTHTHTHKERERERERDRERDHNTPLPYRRRCRPDSKYFVHLVLWLAHFIFHTMGHDRTTGTADGTTELYILWSELSRRMLSPTLATAHYSGPDNAIGLVAQCELSGYVTLG